MSVKRYGNLPIQPTFIRFATSFTFVPTGVPVGMLMLEAVRGFFGSAKEDGFETEAEAAPATGS